MMNRQAFEKLVEEDRAWLEQQPRTLERMHIDELLADAPNRYYGQRWEYLTINLRDMRDAGERRWEVIGYDAAAGTALAKRPLLPPDHS